MNAIKLNCFAVLCFSVFITVRGYVVSKQNQNEPQNYTSTQTNQTKISADLLKQVMWKRCSNNSYVTCAKLALVHAIDKLDTSLHSYSLLPDISVRHAGNPYNSTSEESAHLLGKDFNNALDDYLLSKIKRYLESLTLSVKVLDRNNIEDVRSFGEMVVGSPAVEEGRGKKKYLQAMLMAGWMSGATLLALTLKTIALLSGKAILVALVSLMMSLISSFAKYGETKSTTYEIITKPVVSHSHSTDVHEAHPSEHVGLPYRRSMNLENLISSEAFQYPTKTVLHDSNFKTSRLIPHYDIETVATKRIPYFQTETVTPERIPYFQTVTATPERIPYFQTATASPDGDMDGVSLTYTVEKQPEPVYLRPQYY